MTTRIGLIALTLSGLLLAGCGGSSSEKQSTTKPSEKALQSVSGKLRNELRSATRVNPAQFPSAKGKTLQQVSDSLTGTGTTLGLASSIFTPGINRLAFGVIDGENRYVYAPTVVYTAATPTEQARGPYPAPADLLVTDAPHRSQNAANPKDLFAAIYAAQVPFPKAKQYAILVVSKVGKDLIGAGVSVKVVPKAKDPVAKVGEPAPQVETDTLASVGGDKALLDTRRPFDDMHGVSFKDAVGKKPVALLFATPQLCQSRVCGPVVDIAAQLKAKYGDRVTFIHQEVYKDNDVAKGLRKPLQAFGLPTEPWLFVVGTDGKVVERLEGSFGLNAFEAALQSALKKEEAP